MVKACRQSILFQLNSLLFFSCLATRVVICDQVVWPSIQLTLAQFVSQVISHMALSAIARLLFHFTINVFLL